MQPKNENTGSNNTLLRQNRKTEFDVFLKYYNY